MPNLTPSVRLDSFSVGTICSHQLRQCGIVSRNPLDLWFDDVKIRLCVTDDGQRYYVPENNPSMAYVFHKRRVRFKTRIVGREEVSVDGEIRQRDLRQLVRQGRTEYSVFQIPISLVHRLVQHGNEFFTVVFKTPELDAIRDKIKQNWVGISNKCKDANCTYGVAPHDCYYKLDKQIGESQVHPEETWPDNFEPDPEVPGLGTFHNCGWKKE